MATIFEQLQALAGLLLDGKYDQAVNLWNKLELGVEIKNVTLVDDGLVMDMADGTQQRVTLDEVLAAIKKLADAA